VDITNSDGTPIYARSADKTIIVLADGSFNEVSDGETYNEASMQAGESSATIFSNDDLTIKGNGALKVNANFKNGIDSNDDLKITGGDITVKAVNDGLKGRDSITILDGVISITAGADGLESNNDEESDKGVINVLGGTIRIDAGLDGIHAETRLDISGGDIAIITGGGSANALVREDRNEQRMRTAPTGEQPTNLQMSTPPADRQLTGPHMRTPPENAPQNFPDGSTQMNAEESTQSTKGLKAGVDIIISGGKIQIDSLDDAIHSNDSLFINGGEISLASGDDGMHSDAKLEINDGSITISRSYEGLESAELVINGGKIHITASDDGINAAGSQAESSIGERPGQNEFFMSGDNSLKINGGYIYIDANGDGIDINGPIEMTGGTVIVNGPTRNNDGAVDYLGSFNISGGLMIAVGSTGMAMAPSETSTQYSLLYNFQSVLSAGTLVNMESDEGMEILTFQPCKDYQSLLISSPNFEIGATYNIFTGGISSGTDANGLFSGGAYTSGTKAASVTISNIVTGVGTQAGFPAGPGGGGGRWQPGQ